MSRERAQAVLTTHFGAFGPLNFPYVKMGKIDSLHLFGDTELMIFALYLHNRKRWKNALDIGANLGLHSILMSRLGWNVWAYEPDPDIFGRLAGNLESNFASKVRPFNAAVSNRNGSVNFIRVLDNLTGSHIEGVKDSFGPRESFPVATVDAAPLWDWADFAKIDAEGAEAIICGTIKPRDMKHLDLVMEVRNEATAKDIYRIFSDMDVPMWSQKIEWGQVKRLEDMPKHNREGSLFVGHEGPWK